MTDQVLAPIDAPPRLRSPEVPVTTRRIHRVIAVAFVVLTVGALSTLLADLVFGIGGSLPARVLRRMFSLRKEGGFPAAFSFLMLLGAAGALWFATWSAAPGSSMARYRPRWRLLALLLVAAAFDEAFAFHERLNAPLRQALGLSGVFLFAWVLPYGLAALALGAAMIAPLRALPPRVLGLVLAGGICYIGGAVGMEMLGGELKSSGASRPVYEAQVLVEELLEMAGVWLFVAGVLRLARGRELHLSVR